MEVNKPIINKEYLLQKFPGKGGWTYAAIPEIAQDKHAWFGSVEVSGSIDGYELKKCKLMPRGSGKLFLPVKAAIRKAVNKKEGDKVKIILYSDTPEPVVPEEIITCLMDEPPAYKAWKNLKKEEQQARINLIMSATREELKVERIVKLIEDLR